MRVVLAGDSITASANGEQLLPGTETVNVAVPGFTTIDLKRQVPQIVALAPSILVLLIGTNDLGGLQRDPEDVSSDIADIVRELTELLPATRIVLNAIMPRDPCWTGSIRRINAQLAELARDRHLTYVDTWSALSTPDGAGLDPHYLLDDGFDVHLNDLGYEAWQRTLRAAVSP